MFSNDFRKMVRLWRLSKLVILFSHFITCRAKGGAQPPSQLAYCSHNLTENTGYTFRPYKLNEYKILI